MIYLRRSIHRPIGTLEIQFLALGSFKQSYRHLTSCKFEQNKYILTTLQYKKVIHLARVILWPGNFPEAFIKGQIMSNGVLLRAQSHIEKYVSPVQASDANNIKTTLNMLIL